MTAGEALGGSRRVKWGEGPLVDSGRGLLEPLFREGCQVAGLSGRGGPWGGGGGKGERRDTVLTHRLFAWFLMLLLAFREGRRKYLKRQSWPGFVGATKWPWNWGCTCQANPGELLVLLVLLAAPPVGVTVFSRLARRGD